MVNSGTVIGTDGFGNANERGEWIKIIQSGSVNIGDRVRIGSCTTIDRGAIEDTKVAHDVIIGNQCQIAHNVQIGNNTAVSNGVGMAGSLSLGSHCNVDDGSTLNGHIDICDHVNISKMAMVMSPITHPGDYRSGIPAQEHQDSLMTQGLILNLEDMHRHINILYKNC